MRRLPSPEDLLRQGRFSEIKGSHLRAIERFGSLPKVAYLEGVLASLREIGNFLSGELVGELVKGYYALDVDTKMFEQDMDGWWDITIPIYVEIDLTDMEHVPLGVIPSMYAGIPVLAEAAGRQLFSEKIAAQWMDEDDLTNESGNMVGETPRTGSLKQFHSAFSLESMILRMGEAAWKEVMRYADDARAGFDDPTQAMRDYFDEWQMTANKTVWALK